MQILCSDAAFNPRLCSIQLSPCKHDRFAQIFWLKNRPAISVFRSHHVSTKRLITEEQQWRLHICSKELKGGAVTGKVSSGGVKENVFSSIQGCVRYCNCHQNLHWEKADSRPSTIHHLYSKLQREGKITFHVLPSTTVCFTLSVKL